MESASSGGAAADLQAATVAAIPAGAAPRGATLTA